MTLLSDDIRAHSVTRDDPEAINPGGRVSNVLNILIPSSYIGTPTGILPYDLPLPWNRGRDRILNTTPLHESMWAGALQKAITKQAALGWTVEDRAKNERRAARAQERLLTANGGRGWVPFIFQHLADYLTTDNGAFVELVYRTEYLRSQFLGFVHLDAMRCTRTGDPDIPVIYEDLWGRCHELRAHQVLTFVDMESARAEGRGTGLCATSRAYQTIQKLAAMERYVSEKIAGTSPKEIHIVNGVSKEQLSGALRTAEQDAKNRDLIVYRGVAVMALTALNVTPDGYRIPIAEIPDGFNAKEERDNGYLKYANCLGVPVTDIQPLSGQGLGTGTQSVVIDEAAEGQGLAAWRKQWEHAVGRAIIPETTTFTWTNVNDVREQKAKAEVETMRAGYVTAMVEKGLLTPAQGQQILADFGIIPDAMLAKDETPDDQLTDTEKPVEASDRAAQVAVLAPPALPAPAPAPPAATKARRERIDAGDIGAWMTDAALLSAAAQLAEEARGDG